MAAYLFFPRLLDFALELRLLLPLGVALPRVALERDGELEDRLDPPEPEDLPDAELRVVARELDGRLGFVLGAVDGRLFLPAEVEDVVVEREVRLGGLDGLTRLSLTPWRPGEGVRLCERRILVFGTWDRLSSRFLSVVRDLESRGGFDRSPVCCLRSVARDFGGVVRWPPEERWFVRGCVLGWERRAESSRVVRRGGSVRGFEGLWRRSGAAPPSPVERGLAALR